MTFSYLATWSSRSTARNSSSATERLKRLLGFVRPLSLVSVLLGSATCFGQAIATQVPGNQISSGFSEVNQVQWSLQGPGFFADFGGAGLGGAVAPPIIGPPIAGPPATGGLRTGFGFAGGGVRGSLGLNMASGSSRSISSTSSSVTSLNGAPGSISSQVIRPFVTGVTPVIGSNSFGNPTRENVSSGLFGVQQQRQAAMAQARVAAAVQSKQKAAAEAYERGVRAEESGNLRTARANFRKALKLDQGPLRLQILARLRAHGWL